MANVLELIFSSDDLGKEVSIGEFFYELLRKLWEEKEGFSGKRPFGNSDWDSDLCVCLIKNKLISGSLDEDGYIEDYDYEEFNTFVKDKILPELIK